MPIPYRDVIALRALDDARRAVELSEDHIVATQHDAPNPAWDQVCKSFMSLATVHLGEDIARALFDCLVRSGDDVEECLAIVVGAPQVFVVVAGDGDRSYSVDRVCLSAERANSRTDDLLKTGAFDWVQVLPAELDVSDGTGLDPDPVKAARVEAWLEGVRALTAPLPPGHGMDDPCPGGHRDLTAHTLSPAVGAYGAVVASPPAAATDGDAGSVLTWEQRVTAAVAAVFPGPTARAIVASDAFLALVFRVREHAEAADLSPASALMKLDADTIAFASGADNPAAFLASRVAQLPL